MADMQAIDRALACAQSALDEAMRVLALAASDLDTAGCHFQADMVREARGDARAVHSYCHAARAEYAEQAARSADAATRIGRVLRSVMTS